MSMMHKFQEWIGGRQGNAPAPPEPRSASRPSAIIIGPQSSAADGATTIVRPGDGGRRSAPVRIGPASAVRIDAPRRGLWDERGWVCENRPNLRIYQGEFRVRRWGGWQRWSGRILAQNRGEITLYIADPPEKLRHHPKWPCFQHEEGRWFRLHWHRRAQNVDDAIAYMERILDEALR